MTIQCYEKDGFYYVVSNYERYESLNISKSVCTCRHWKEASYAAECVCYDKKDNVVQRFSLSNGSVWLYYTRKTGISLAFNDKYAILPGNDKNKPACVEIATNRILWTWPTGNYDEPFVYKQDKAFVAWDTVSKGGITLFNGKTGEVLREVVSYNTKYMHPSFFRLNEDNLLIYSVGGVFLLNLESETIYLSKINFDEMPDYVRLRNLITDDENGVTIFTLSNTRSNSFYPENGLDWEYKEVSIKNDELFLDIKPSPFELKIPTTKFTIERERKKVWHE